MNSMRTFRFPPSSVISQTDNDLDECEVLLKSTIDTLRDALRGDPARRRFSGSVADAVDSSHRAQVHPLTLPQQGGRVTSHSLTRLIGRILLTLLVLGFSGFLVLVLIGLRADFPTKSISVSSASQDAVRLVPVAPAYEFEQGTKLVGVGAVGTFSQGMSIALSADGGTAVVGAPGPNNAERDRSPLTQPVGAAWVFARNGGAWNKRGIKLVGITSAYGGGLWSQGASVAVSAEGSTALVGGPSDDRTMGAAWVFTRDEGAWTQQGEKLVGTHREVDAAVPLGQGMSVALSADGNTALIGAWRAEGVWVFTRSGSVWKQQGNKLVGAGAVGNARQGMSVALSADGNTAIVGGWSDNSKTGAAWVFTRKDGAWKQQGKKLVGTGSAGTAYQGTSVALSADGNTAIVGGPGHESHGRLAPFGLGTAGAAWIFRRTGEVWIQEGDPLAATSAAGSARQGMSVALSADGNTALVGGMTDDTGVGAASTFIRTGGHWTQNKKLIGTGPMAVSSVGLSADGSVAIIGASNESGGIGAAWVFNAK
jgi:hypothetical protein